MAARHHGSTISGRQQNQRRQPQNEHGKKVRGFFIDKVTNLHVHHAILYIPLPSLHPCDMKLPNFRRSLYGVGEHNTDVVFFFF